MSAATRPVTGSPKTRVQVGAVLFVGEAGGVIATVGGVLSTVTVGLVRSATGTVSPAQSERPSALRVKVTVPLPQPVSGTVNGVESPVMVESEQPAVPPRTRLPAWSPNCVLLALTSNQGWTFVMSADGVMVTVAGSGPMPATRTRVALSVLEPSPSWPSAFGPQQRMPPLVIRAQAAVPVSMAVTVARLATATGVSDSFVLPVPSRPLAPLPQHWAAPSVRTAQVLYQPARDTGDAREAAHRDRSGGGVLRAVPDLAVAVGAPAAGRSVGEDRAAMVPGVDGGCGRDPADEDRRRLLPMLEPLPG